MRQALLLLFIVGTCTSCAIYKQRFDCKSEPGVPCTSVTDLEQMIIETDCGPDLFIDDSVEQSRPRICSAKIWIADPCERNGGYYERVR